MRKILIKGNHDNLDLKDYLPYFDDIRGSHQFDGFLLGHIPVHPDSLGRFGHMIHGRLHANRVMKPNTYTDRSDDKMPDERYINVSMECLDNYMPVSLEELKKRVKIST